MTGDSTEAEDWEAPVIVVGLNDTTNIDKSRLILVAGTHEVERVPVAGVTVRGCVVDGTHHRDLPASAEVIDKGRSNENLQVIDDKRSSLATFNRRVTSLKLGN